MNIPLEGVHYPKCFSYFHCYYIPNTEKKTLVLAKNRFFLGPKKNQIIPIFHVFTFPTTIIVCIIASILILDRYWVENGCKY